MVYVTHDQVEAMTMADKCVVRNGVVVEQIGSPRELYHHPRNLVVAGFIGSPKMNLIETRVVGVDERAATVALPGGAEVAVPVVPGHLAAGETVRLGVRPEHLALADDGALRGEAMLVEHLGGETCLYVQTGGGTIVVQADGDVATTEGETVGLALNGDACHLFDRNVNPVPKPARPRLADRKRRTPR